MSQPTLLSLSSAWTDKVARTVPLTPELAKAVTDVVFPPAPPPPALAALVLVDAVSGRDLLTLSNSTPVDLGKLGVKLNVRADPDPAGRPVQSVIFKLDGKVVSKESFAPFTAFGDSGDEYNPWTPPAGDHTLEAQPFSSTGGSGVAGPPLVVNLHVTPPPAPPAPVIVVANDVVVCQRKDDLSDKVALLKAGQTLLLERGGVWREPLALGASHQRVKITATGVGDDPQITGDYGMMVNAPVDGVSVSGISFLAKAGAKGNGLHVACNRVTNLTVEDCVFQGFMDNLVVQCPKMKDAALADYHKNLTFRRLRLLDSHGPTERDGQGWFLMNVDGLTVESSVISGCGMTRLYQGQIRDDIYCHGGYTQHGNKRVVIRGNVFDKCESFGVQCRGSLHDSTLPDDGDPGPDVDGNVFNDCGIGFLINGYRGLATNNLVNPGHFHWPVWHHGQGGGNVHVGTGVVSNNRRFAGPDPVKARSDWRMPFLTIGPRPREQGWEWDRLVDVTRSTNYDFPDVRLELSDLMVAARLDGKIEDVVKACHERADATARGKKGVLV